MWELASGQAVGFRFQRRDCELPLFLLHSSLERMKVTSHQVQSALGMTLHSKRQLEVLWRHSTEQWLFSKWSFCTSLSLLQVNQVTKGEREGGKQPCQHQVSAPLHCWLTVRTEGFPSDINTQEAPSQSLSQDAPQNTLQVTDALVTWQS